VPDLSLGFIHVLSYTDCMCERTERRDGEISRREKVKKNAN
jgi:hypothetical protein